MTSQALYWAAGVVAGGMLQAVGCPLALMVLITAATMIAISWEDA